MTKPGAGTNSPQTLGGRGIPVHMELSHQSLISSCHCKKAAEEPVAVTCGCGASTYEPGRSPAALGKQTPK